MTLGGEVGMDAAMGTGALAGVRGAAGGDRDGIMLQSDTVSRQSLFFRAAEPSSCHMVPVWIYLNFVKMLRRILWVCWPCNSRSHIQKESKNGRKLPILSRYFSRAVPSEVQRVE